MQSMVSFHKAFRKTSKIIVNQLIFELPFQETKYHILRKILYCLKFKVTYTKASPLLKTRLVH